MPRTARIVVPGCPHHITQKGNGGQDVFFCDDDRRYFLSLLARYAGPWGLSIDAFCLMTNHVHLVATPAAQESLAEAMRRISGIYAQYVNRTYARQGHLWQDRFYSCALDDAHCWAALVYVEQNPVRANMISQASRYEWSSAAAHCGHKAKAAFLDLRRWKKMAGPAEWKRELSSITPDDALASLRRHTGTGRPLGGPDFITRIERSIKRRVHALVRGRPRGRKMR